MWCINADALILTFSGAFEICQRYCGQCLHCYDTDAAVTHVDTELRGRKDEFLVIFKLRKVKN